jgi:hypothetical protein
MTVGAEDASKKYVRDRKINLSGVSMKNDQLVVLIRHDSAEIWVFGYSITLGLGTKKKGQHRHFESLDLCTQ